MDASLGFEQQLRERGKLRVQVDLQNATDRLNVINFAGLFSGNSIAPPRSYGLRLQTTF